MVAVESGTFHAPMLKGIRSADPAPVTKLAPYGVPPVTSRRQARKSATRHEAGEKMHSVHVKQIQDAVAAARHFAQKSTLDGCDLSDIDELASPLARELERPQPNTQTLATYLNSLLRSLRGQPHAEEICSQLDEVMKESGIATDWQHG
jgi:hypothetical protein